MDKLKFLGEDPQADIAEVALVHHWAQNIGRYADLPDLNREIAEMARDGAGPIIRHFFHINPIIKELSFAPLADAYDLYLFYVGAQALDFKRAGEIKDQCEEENKKVIPYIARMYQDGKTGADLEHVPMVFLVYGHASSMLGKLVQWEMAGRTDLRQGLKLLYESRNNPKGPAAPGPA